MNKNPLVSVIIPNYNHARYLDQRLQTVLNQTYQNFEVIILDDKSTDNSLEVIAKYKGNPHIAQIVVNEQNSGSTFKQWDKGIHLAKGELIWIAESDDYCELNLLEELVQEMQQHPFAVVTFSSYVFVSENNSILGSSKVRKNHCYSGRYYIKNKMIRYNCIRNVSGAIFKKNVFEKIPKKYQTYKSSGDWLFWLEIANKGDVIEVNENLTYYRLHTGSVTSNKLTKGITDTEDKEIFDCVAHDMKLNFWQKWRAQCVHAKRCRNTLYETESIKSEIYKLWEVDKFNYVWINWVDRISGILERHLNILL